MIFHVGQEVRCVDDSLPRNQWHRAHPLIKGRVYSVISLEGPSCIDIDGSGRAWQNWRFRPLIKTDISVFTRMLEKVPARAQ